MIMKAERAFHPGVRKLAASIGLYRTDEDGNAVRELDLMRWGKWFANEMNRTVQINILGDVRVSTMFLGIDHKFGLHGKPVLWETMVFGGEHEGKQERYTSLKDAKLGHQVMLSIVTDSL